ncbi:MAG: thiol reductant ABC exporter subunit CydD [Acidimicrobiales bacterium]
MPRRPRGGPARAPARGSAPRSAPRGPVDGRLLRELVSARNAIASSVVVGLVATAAVLVQAIALATLLTGAMDGMTRHHEMVAFVWLAVGAAVRGSCALAGELFGRLGAASAKADLRSRLVNAAVRDAPTGGSTGPGALASVAGRGLDALDVYVGRCLPDLVLAVAAPVALAAAIGVLDWVSGLVIVVVIALFPIFGALVGRAGAALAEERWRQVEALGRQIADVFEGLPVLKAFGRSPEQRARIERAGDALRRSSLATLRTAFLSALVLDTLASLSVALVAVPLGLRLLTGSVHLEAALAVLIVAPEVFLPLRKASAEFHESSEGLAAAAHALGVIERGRPDPATSGNAPEVVARRVSDPARVPVALRSVRLDVPGRDAPVLDGADLVIEPGETVVLVGPSGAGKSTVLSLLLGFVSPTRGSVTVGEDDLRTLDLKQWRRFTTYLPEHPTLLRASLAENLRIANPVAPDDQLVDALRVAGAAHLLRELEAGLDTPIGEGMRAISAGELQRIALARTLLRPASLYLLDEPTVHLDDVTETAVIDGLRNVLRGRSALIVTHRPAVMDLADRVLTLSEGRFTEVARQLEVGLLAATGGPA